MKACFVFILQWVTSFRAGYKKSLCVCVYPLCFRSQWSCWGCEISPWVPPLHSPLVLFALPSSVAQNTSKFNRESLCLSPLLFFHHVHPWINQSRIRTSCINTPQTLVLIGLYINLIHYIDHFLDTLDNFWYKYYHTTLTIQILF